LKTGIIENKDTNIQENEEYSQNKLNLPKQNFYIKKYSTGNNPNKTGEELTVAFT